MQPWRAVDSHNGGVETQNGAVEGLKTNGRRFESQDTGPHQSEKSDPDPHQVKRWIRIRNTGTGITQRYNSFLVAY